MAPLWQTDNSSYAIQVQSDGEVRRAPRSAQWGVPGTRRAYQRCWSRPARLNNPPAVPAPAAAEPDADDDPDDDVPLSQWPTALAAAAAAYKPKPKPAPEPPKACV